LKVSLKIGTGKKRKRRTRKIMQWRPIETGLLEAKLPVQNPYTLKMLGQRRRPPPPQRCCRYENFELGGDRREWLQASRVTNK